jgi:cytoskeletal protein RodZ
MLNTPQAVLVVLAIVVAGLSFLYFAYYLPRTTPAPPASPPRTEQRVSSPPTTLETTRSTTNGGETTSTTNSPTEASPTATATAPERFEIEQRIAGLSRPGLYRPLFMNVLEEEFSEVGGCKLAASEVTGTL